MAEFKHLDIEGLPEGWGAEHFGQLVNYALGRTPPRNEAVYWKDGTYPWVSISDMEPYGTVTSTSEKVTALAFEKVFRGQLVPEGSLLMSFKLTIGRIARLGMPALHNEAIISFRPQHKKVNEDYLAYYLSQINYADYQDKAIKGHTLNKGKIDALEIALPPVAEQKRIAQVLRTVQAAIEQQERLIRTTTELKQALMQKLFTEGLRGEAQKETEIGLVPESWEVVKVGAITTIKSSAMAYSELEAAASNDAGVRVMGVKVSDMNLPGNEIEFRSANLERSLADVVAYKRAIPPHAVVFPKRGAAIATNKKRIATCYTVLDPNLIAVIPHDVVDSQYLYHWFDTFDLKKITDPGPTPQLNKKDIAPLQMPLPSMAEQREIASTIDALDAKIKAHGIKQNTLQALFRTLLHELMTGKVRVGEFKFEPLG